MAKEPYVRTCKRCQKEKLLDEYKNKKGCCKNCKDCRMIIRNYNKTDQTIAEAAPMSREIRISVRAMNMEAELYKGSGYD